MSQKESSVNGSQMEATLLLRNGNIRTFDEKGTTAKSLAAAGDRIIGVASDDSLAGLVGSQTAVIDLGGRTVVPGFIDAHEHLSQFSEMRLQLDLSPSRIDNSLRKLLNLVQSEAQSHGPGEWVRGVLYDDTKLKDGRGVTIEDLDAVAPENPVILHHVSGNIGVLNSEALRRGNIGSNTPDPKGGKIGRDTKTRQLTGYLFSNALFQFAFNGFNRGQPVVPPFERDVRNKALIEGAKILNAAGVTSVSDAWVSPDYVMSYHDVTQDRSLPMRVNMLLFYLWLPELETLKLTGNWGNEYFRCTGIKLITDGAIAGRTAALRNAYTNDPDDHGILVFESQDELNQVVSRIHRLGYQACIHANGDIAIDMALDAIEKAQSQVPRPEVRHRIEHCTVINSNILKRMRDLNVMAIPFGSYLWQHGEKILPYYGEKRAQMMFGHKSFLDAGVKVAGSSDHPAGLLPPLLGIQTMVTRKTSSGEVIGSNQRISLEEAFKMYTVYAAYATYEEDIKGSLAVGKLADFVVLAEDPWKVDAEEISEIEIDMTILGGRIVYECS
jgi:predicted amidohydrolase YtcJ